MPAMQPQYLVTLVALVPVALGFPNLADFPKYHSLAGLSAGEVQAVAQVFSSTPGAQPLPPPIQDTSGKLVNDPEHPFKPTRPGDIRGPCPGLNTLASHGYIDRTGVATPAEIITAAQEGFNMGYNLASFVTYTAFVVDGNHLTNMMSIGANVTEDHEFTTGINTHGNFEGDASITRSDYFLGDNIHFNETLFDQLAYAADLVGDGKITIDTLALHKSLRINDSIARNPTFTFDYTRYTTAFTEATIPIALFVSNQTADTTTNGTLEAARSFFDFHRFPEGFYRRQAPYDFDQLGVLFDDLSNSVGILPGHNEGVNNYIVTPEVYGTRCSAYQEQVNLTARLYPDPPSELRSAIKANLITYYKTVEDSTCPQLFPYGQ